VRADIKLVVIKRMLTVTAFVILGLLVTSSSAPLSAQQPQAVKGISYGLVVDDSGSLLPLLQQIRTTAKLIVSNNVSNDEAFILLFTDAKHITRLQDLTHDKQTLTEAAGDIYIQGGDTAILDTLYEATHYLAENISRSGAPRRRALILLSDGEDRASKRKLADVLTYLHEKGVVVYVVATVSQLEKDRGKKAVHKATEFLTSLATQTGGHAYFPRDTDELTRNLTELFQKLRNQ